MERHDTSMRAVRYLMGAGTFAAAMLAMTAGPSAETTSCLGEAVTVCGHVFTDVGTADNDFTIGEGTENVTVVLTDLSGQVVSSTIAQPGNPTMSGSCADGPDQPGCGYYEFTITESGTYLVCIVLAGQSNDCSNASEHPEAMQVTAGATNQFVDFPLPSGGGEEPPAVWGVGTGTPGYWKNHPEAWPGPVTVGGVTYVNAQTAVAPNKTMYDAIKLMGKVSGDKTISMFAALISAKLNSMLANNTACITDAVTKADAWMVAHPVGSGVKASSTAWSEGADAWHTTLDDYNNGKLCAPHRD